MIASYSLPIKGFELNLQRSYHRLLNGVTDMTVPFASEARHHFDVVAKKFELSCALSTERNVRFENDRIFLDVNFDNGRSYELGVELGKKEPQKPERPFSLAEVLRLRGAAEAKSIDGIMVSDSSRLGSALNTLSLLTAQHATDFLLGNALSFEQVARQRERESDAYALEASLRTARARSEAAWTKRNYLNVVSALEPLGPHLSPSEKRRLEYARLHR